MINTSLKVFRNSMVMFMSLLFGCLSLVSYVGCGYTRDVIERVQ